MCVDAPQTGLPIGSSCTPESDACEGFCLNFASAEEPFYQCTAFCTFGGGCGLAEGAQVLPGAPLCLPLFSVSDDIGDAGLCIQRCDCNDDCNDPGAICDPFGDPTFEEALEALGFCIQPATPEDTGLACE
jgi:hypothetical protein